MVRLWWFPIWWCWSPTKEAQQNAHVEDSCWWYDRSLVPCDWWFPTLDRPLYSSSSLEYSFRLFSPHIAIATWREQWVDHRSWNSKCCYACLRKVYAGSNRNQWCSKICERLARWSAALTRLPPVRLDTRHLLLRKVRQWKWASIHWEDRKAWTAGRLATERAERSCST